MNLKERIEALEKRRGEIVTVRLRVPNRDYTGRLINYDDEYLIFDEGELRYHVSKDNIIFPN